MKTDACERSGMIEAQAVLGAITPKLPVSLALIEDNDTDAIIFSHLMERSKVVEPSVRRFIDVDSFLSDRSEQFNVIILDRFLSPCGLSEGRIREMKSRHPNAGIVMYTGLSMPSLRSNAIQEGAMAVVEKGALSGAELELLIMAAACVGPKVSN